MWSSTVLGVGTRANVWIVTSSFVLIAIVAISATLLIIFGKNKKSVETRLPNMQKRDFTVKELSQFDGTGPDGRILIAVNGFVFDVTNNGKEFYGKDGPYSIFAGRDASRSLTMFSTDIPAQAEEYDDLSDLTSEQMKNLKEWELQFRERYPLVGKLLSPSETHHLYENEEACPADLTPSSSKSKSE